VHEIWQDVLGAERVGIHESFFEVGGHSLLATQVISRLRDTFGVNFAVRLLFETPTIAGLAEAAEKAVAENKRDDGPALVRLSRESRTRPIHIFEEKLTLIEEDLQRSETEIVEDVFIFPTSFAQQRLWFLNQLEPESPAYNVSAAVRLEGRLDVDALARSLNEIVRRHEALRTTFAELDGSPVQVIAASCNLALPLLSLRKFHSRKGRLR
jgi:acyl carrier protein